MWIKKQLSDGIQYRFIYFWNHQALLYLISLLDPLVKGDYIILYFHTLTEGYNHPSMQWMREVYNVLEYKHKKNLKAFYIIHPTFWTKVIIIIIIIILKLLLHFWLILVFIEIVTRVNSLWFRWRSCGFFGAFFANGFDFRYSNDLFKFFFFFTDSSWDDWKLFQFRKVLSFREFQKVLLDRFSKDFLGYFRIGFRFSKDFTRFWKVISDSLASSEKL